MKLYTYRPSSNTVALIKDFAPQLAPGQPDYLFEMHVDAHDHGDLGTGTRVGHGNFSGGYNFRSLSNVHSLISLFEFKDANGVVDSSQNRHDTLYADDESWVTLGLFHDPTETGADTGAMPKQTISRDGRFIAFTSNWGNSGRYDLFIARIEPAH